MPSVDQATLERRLRAARLVPVIRVGNPADAEAIVSRLLAAGLDCVEITTTIPGWEGIVRSVLQTSSEVLVGVGTVTTAAQADAAVATGAQFCVSPRLAPEARAVLHAAEMPFIEGGLTPTELAEATSHGIAKLFPAHVGGVRYLRSLLAVMPDARIMPTGGIPLGEVGEWLAAGAIAVGVGSDLTAPGDIGQRVADALGR